MKTDIFNEGALKVIKLSGYLDFESVPPIHESIESLYDSDEDVRIMVDMSELQFVGSSGISEFIKGMKTFNRFQMRPVYVGVKSEFRKIFKLFEDKHPFEILENRDEAFSFGKSLT